MTLKPLHKNSGKSKKEFTLGSFFFYMVKAEDGYWSYQNKDGTTESRLFFAIKSIKREGFDEKVLSVVIGKWCFYATKMKGV